MMKSDTASTHPSRVIRRPKVKLKSVREVSHECTTALQSTRKRPVANQGTARLVIREYQVSNLDVKKNHTNPKQSIEAPKRISRGFNIMPIQPACSRCKRDHGFELTRRCGTVRTNSDIAIWSRDD